MRVLGFVLIVITSVMAGVQQYGPETWFQQDPAPAPIIAESIGNPLDYAAARIGLDVRNVELPRGWEGGYRYCCRFAVIDYVSNRPLYMKQRAEDNSAQVVAKSILAHWPIDRSRPPPGGLCANTPGPAEAVPDRSLFGRYVTTTSSEASPPSEYTVTEIFTWVSSETSIATPVVVATSAVDFLSTVLSSTAISPAHA